MSKSTVICNWIFGIILAYGLWQDNWFAIFASLWWFGTLLGCHFTDQAAARKEFQLELARRIALDETNRLAK